MAAYYATYTALLCDNLPALGAHMESEGVTPDLYLVDWLYTLFSKSLPLDVACRIWDVFLRDGETFLVRAALGESRCRRDAGPARSPTTSNGENILLPNRSFLCRPHHLGR